MTDRTSNSKSPLKLESTGGKLLSFSIDADGELLAEIDDSRAGGGFMDFMLSVSDLQRLREWLGSSPETKAPRTLSATERLHNLCDALSEHADESPFTREEWDAIDRQTVRLTNALRGLIEAVRSIEIDRVSWDTSVAKPLAAAYRALKHEDPVPESAVKSNEEPPGYPAKKDADPVSSGRIPKEPQ